MSHTKEDPIIDYLKRRKWPWVRFRGVYIDPSYFEGSPDFSAAAQNLSDFYVTNADDFDPTLKIKYTKHFKGVKAREPFVVISGYTGFLIITPVRYWSCLDQYYSTGKTAKIDIEIICYETEVTEPRPKDKVVGKTWVHIAFDVTYRLGTACSGRGACA